MRTLKGAVMLVVLAGALAGCGGKKAKCEKAMDKVVSLMSKDENMKGFAEMMKSKKGEFVEKCVKEVDEKDLDCVSSANSMEDLSKCKGIK